ncbi:MAG: DUF1801 domain-containing protein [Acidimicrobiales bacterium]
MDLIDTLVDGRPELLADATRAVADSIGCCDVELDSSMKWGRVSYAIEGDFHHWICAIGVTKKAVGLTFHFGGLLDDPEGRLMAGSSKFLRKLEFTSPHEVDAEVVCDFVDQAVGKHDYFKEHWKELR